MLREARYCGDVVHTAFPLNVVVASAGTELVKAVVEGISQSTMVGQESCVGVVFVREKGW